MSNSEPSVSRDDFKRVMGCFAAGVTVITTVDADGKPHALTATAFTSLSKDPPLCLVCVDRNARAHSPIVEAKRFAVNFLSAGQDAVSNNFASQKDDKFAEVAWRPADKTGSPLLPDTLAWLDCRLEAVHPGGDHDIFVGRLVEVGTSDSSPLLYFRGRYAELEATS